MNKKKREVSATCLQQKEIHCKSILKFGRSIDCQALSLHTSLILIVICCRYTRYYVA